jgi:O-antigen ligase
MSARSFVERTGIWVLAFRKFPESPLFGFGTGSFVPVVWGGQGGNVAHNAFVSILVEDGAIGLVLFVAATFFVFRDVWRMPKAERNLWAAVLAIWSLGAMVSPWEYGKLTWYLFATIVTLSRALRDAPEGRRTCSPRAASPRGGAVAWKGQFGAR